MDAKLASILVLEDEWLIAEDVARILRRLGYQVIGPALDPGTAEGLLATHHPNAALLDILVGQKTCYPLADILAKRGIPFAFATAFGATDLPERFAGCPLVTKPFGEARLRATIRSLF